MIGRSGTAIHLSAGHSISRSPTLIDREDEITVLSGALTAPGSLMVVEGEAGIGKSRLVAECITGLPSATRVLIGHCHESTEPFLLGPIVEAIRDVGDLLRDVSMTPLAGALRPLVPELSEYLPAEPDSIGDPGADRHRIYRALRELLGSLGRTVLVVEDLHWADDGTLSFLSFLRSQQIEDLSVVATVRPEESPRLAGFFAKRPGSDGGYPSKIALKALDVNGVNRQIGSILGSQVSEEFAAFLHQHTEGVPFAVEEVLHLLAQRGDLITQDGIWKRRFLEKIDVPDAIRDTTIQRVQKLEPDVQALVKAAAVMGGSASLSLLSRVAEMPERRAIRALEPSLRLAILTEQQPGLYGFRHSLARQAVYESLTTAERRQMHERAARVHKSEGDERLLPDVAHHYRAAGRTREWLIFGEKAADYLINKNDDAAASRLLLDALDARPIPSSTRIRLAAKLGTAARYGPAHAEAAEKIRAVIEEEKMPQARRGELRLLVGTLLYQAGDAAGSRDQEIMALQELSRNPVLKCRALLCLATPYEPRAHITEHLHWMEEAVDLAARHSDPATKIAAHGARATLLITSGDQEWSAMKDIPRDDSSAECRRESIRAATNLASSAFDVGHYAHAKSFVGQALGEAKRFDYLILAAALRSMDLMLRWVDGSWQDLEAMKAIDPLGESFPISRLGAMWIRGSLHLAKGTHKEAEALFSAVAQESANNGDIPSLVRAADGLGRIHLAGERNVEALEVTSRALGHVRTKGIYLWGAEVLATAVESLATCGRVDEARGLVTEFRSELRGRDAPGAHAALAMAEGKARAWDTPQEGARHFALAEDAYERMSYPYKVALAAESRGNSIVELDLDEGGDALIRALEIFNRLGASWDEARVRKALREHGVALPYPWRGGRRNYGDELTPRELEVARLAGVGHTNREIAQLLFLSPRTVEKQVVSAMRKRKVSSRKALIDLDGVPDAPTEAKMGVGHPS